MNNKNDPNEGGSAYLQSKFFNAKEILMVSFPLEEEEYREKHKITRSDDIYPEENDE